MAAKLSRQTAEPVSVKALLVLPGLYVERTGKGKIVVVNDHRKELRAAILDPKATLMDLKQRQRMVELLEQWSRDSMALK